MYVCTYICTYICIYIRILCTYIHIHKTTHLFSVLQHMHTYIRTYFDVFSHLCPPPPPPPQATNCPAQPPNHLVLLCSDIEREHPAGQRIQDSDMVDCPPLLLSSDSYCLSPVVSGGGVSAFCEWSEECVCVCVCVWCGSGFVVWVFGVLFLCIYVCMGKYW